MKKILLITVALTYVFVQAQAQNQLYGVVTDSLSNHISFATVELRNTQTNTSKHTLTDMYGNYVINADSTGNFAITISCLGYSQLTAPILINEASVLYNIVLAECSVELESVTVSAATIQQDIDKKVYFITKDNRRATSSALELMKIVPELNIDHINQKIINARGGNIKLLLNGANATDEEVKTVDAQNVKNIEYYDFPTGRYTGYSAVVNIITKQPKDGLTGGFSLQHAFSTWFFNDNIFLKYNRGQSQLSVNYDIAHRNYSNVYNNKSYEYSLNGVEYSRFQTAQRKFGYSLHNIDFTYTNTAPDKYVFQFKFSPNYSDYHSGSDLDIVFNANKNQQHRSGLERDKYRQFSPNVDLYYWRKLKNNQELAVNFVGTYHSLNQNYSNSEYFAPTQTPIFENYTRLNNSKYSVIGEVLYEKSFEKITLSFGDNISFGRLSSLFDDTDKSGEFLNTTVENYLYADLYYKFKRFMLRATIGGSYIYNTNNYTKYHSFILRPTLMLGYSISPALSVRVAYTRNATAPSLSWLSDSRSIIAENIVQQGNPFLRNSSNHYGHLLIGYNKPWLNLSVGTVYQYNKDPINSYFIASNNTMLLTYENATSLQSSETFINAFINPFKKSWFTIRLNGAVKYTRVASNQAGSFSDISYPLNYELAFNYKDLSVFYQGNIVTWQLDGPYMSTYEKTSTLGLKYQYKNFNFTALCMFFFADPIYKTRTIDGSVVKFNATNLIKDNKNMVTIGLSYRFNLGKKAGSTRQYLNNADNDSGVIKHD